MTHKKLSILIVLVSLVLAITSLWDDSFVVDEIPHVGAGYSYIQKGDYRLNPEHPPLAKDLAGLALSFLAVDQSAFSTQYWNSDINGQWYFGRMLIYTPLNVVDAITRTAKTSMLLFFILSTVLIYKWANERYGSTGSPQAGKRAAFIAILLFSFSPTVMAHSRFVTTDVPALFGALLAVYYFLSFLQKPSRKLFWLAVIAFGVAQLTKFSLVLLAPLFVLLVIVWSIANSFSFKTLVRSVTRTITLMAAGIILVVWPIYALHTLNYPPEKQRIDTVEHLRSYGNRLFADPVVWASDKLIVRPLAHYATGILMVNQRSIGGNTTFFLGEVRNQAWKKYFPVVYAIKEPLAFWFLILITALFLGTRTRFKILNFKFKIIKNLVKENFTEFSMLSWIAIYWYFSINTNLNIGVRHLLPTYGFVYILLAGQLTAIGDRLKAIGQNKKLKAYGLLLIAFFGWYVVENIRIYPYYLTYFNQLVGGPANGYKYVVDSNLDWGQDLKRLAAWVEDNNVEKIHFDYFGWANPSYYLKGGYIGIRAGDYKSANEFLRKNPGDGYIAVSASFYMGSRDNPNKNHIWLDSYKPIAVIGNSIFVWKISR